MGLAEYIKLSYDWRENKGGVIEARDW